MGETLTTSELANSREAKRTTTDRREREKVVAKQVARIGKKFIDRSNANKLGNGPYGSSEGSYSSSKTGPNGEKLFTTIKVDQGFNGEPGTVHITEGTSNGIGEVGTEVSAVPTVGIGARKYARAGDHEVGSRLEGDRETSATDKVPAQLAELRGSLAQDEIAKQQRNEEFNNWIRDGGPYPGSSAEAAPVTTSSK